MLVSISCSATGSSKLFCPGTGGVTSSVPATVPLLEPLKPLYTSYPLHSPCVPRAALVNRAARPAHGHITPSAPARRHIWPLRRRMQSPQTTPRDSASPGGGASLGSFRRRSKTGQRGGCGDGRRCKGGSSLQPSPGGHALRVGGAWPLSRDASPRGTHPKLPAALPGPTGPALAGSCG